MKRLTFCLTFVSILSLTSYSTLVLPQDLDNATISGQVRDQHGAVISGALVEIILEKTGLQRKVSTDSSGLFRLTQIEPGPFSLYVTSPGFAALQKSTLSVIAGQHARFEITLFPELIRDSVTVSSSENDLIDTSRTVVGSTLTAREIDGLPIFTRSPLDLVLLLSGVAEEPLATRDLAEDSNTFTNSTPEEAGIFSLAGGPAYSNNITIDGLDNNDDRAARERFQPSLEAIDEVQIITNQFSAEYGRASGGRVNLRTKGGAKDYRGRAYYYFRDEALNANSFRNNTLGLKRLPFQEHNPGATFSGPLLQSRAFFFGSYEFATVLDDALIDTVVPVQQHPLFPLPNPTSLERRRVESVEEPAIATEIAPYIKPVNTPSRNHRTTIRLDHAFTDLHSGSLVFQLGISNNLRQFGGGNRLIETLQANSRKSDSISYSDTWVLSPNVILQTRLQSSLLVPSLRSPKSGSPVVLIGINDPLAVGDAERRSGTLVAGASTTGSTHRREERLQFQSILNCTRSVHSLKLGLDVQRVRSTFINLADASGTFNFASAGDFLAGRPSRFRQNFNSDSTQRNTYLGIFFQDEWRAAPNLTVSYGLRYEKESILNDVNNLGPRFSLAYDPFSSGKTVVRLGGGIFYNRPLLRTIDDFTLGTRRRFFDTDALRDPVTERALTASERRAFISENIVFPLTLSEDSLIVQKFATLDTGFSRRLEPNLRIPESYQVNIGFERQLARGLSVEANYTFNRGIHLWREFNANAAVLPDGYKDFTEYLLSRDFPNIRRGPFGLRPLYNATTAGELVRFVIAPANSANPNAIGRTTEFGVPLSLVNLNSLTSTTAVEIALAALNHLRPDPTRVEVEQLIAAGNSFYRALTLQARKVFRHRGYGLATRMSYTFSHLIDDGIVNTSDALKPGDFRGERARSLLDRRHRLVFSGLLDLPGYLARIRVAPVLRLASGAPFNISIGGADRNLDDVSNDRPIFLGDVKEIKWRRPGDQPSPALAEQFRLPTIGQSGNLPRNAGQGPGTFRFDLGLSRELRIGERVRIRLAVEADNVLNKTVFSFGAEFINFNALGPGASGEQRQAFLDSFLLATRTQRPRQLRFGMRLDF